MTSLRTKQLNPRDGYNLWAQTYASEEDPIRKCSDKLIANWLGDLRGKLILDVGCGTGKFCRLASKKGAAKIIGVDLSPKMLEEAKKNCRDASLKEMDLSKEKIEGHFDVVVCALVLDHIWDLRFALANLIDNLAKDGVLLITDLHPFQIMKGAKRTFRDEKSKQIIEIKHHVHSFERYYEILSQTPAFIEEVVEPKCRGERMVFGMRIRNRNQ